MARTKIAQKHNPYKTNAVYRATFTVGAEATNAITVSIQLKDELNQNIGARVNIRAFLSNDVNGDSFCTTAPTTATAAGANGALTELSGKEFSCTSEADGTLTIVITDSGTPTFYLILVMPDGSLFPCTSPITFA